MMPISKLTHTTTHSFRDLVICAPTRSPMGSMAVSAPRVNKPIPTISSTAPTKNASSTSVGTGAAVKHKISTIRVIGTTEASASLTFSPNIVFVWPIWSRHFFRSPANKRTASFADDHLMDLSYHFSP